MFGVANSGMKYRNRLQIQGHYTALYNGEQSAVQ